MADTLYFSRDTKVFVKIGSAIWEMPVLDGFSFSQATNASEITLNEMADTSGNSRRGRQMFTDSYAPAEWSFSTYMRPFKASGSGNADDTQNSHHAVEEVLWALMVGDAAYASYDFTGFTRDTTDLDIAFTSSNKTTLGEADIFFVMGGAGSGTKTTYKIAGCVVNEASLDFDIDGIATINWSGFGKIITEETTFDASGALPRRITSTSNFIRNRLTTLDVAYSVSSSAVTYLLTLTGGNITFSNNITFLTPETLGIVNQPLGHVTGTRSISGNFTCYLDTTANKSRDLFEHVIEATSTVTNSFDMAFNIGGGSAPKLVVDIPTAHLEVPTHSIDDVISVEANFHALPSTIDGTNEATVAYTG